MGDFSASQHLHPPFTLPDCVSSVLRHRGTPTLPLFRGAPGCKPLPARSLKSERWPRFSAANSDMCTTLASWVCREVKRSAWIGRDWGSRERTLCSQPQARQRCALFFQTLWPMPAQSMVCLNTSIFAGAGDTNQWLYLARQLDSLRLQSHRHHRGDGMAIQLQVISGKCSSMRIFYIDPAPIAW